MKDLFLIGGPKGARLAEVCGELKALFEGCAVVNGDALSPSGDFSGEDLELALDNVCHVLNNFLRTESVRKVLFYWTPESESSLVYLRRHLHLENCDVHTMSLICTPKTLEERLNGMIGRGECSEREKERVLALLPFYENFPGEKADGDRSPAEIAQTIFEAATAGSAPQKRADLPREARRAMGAADVLEVAVELMTENLDRWCAACDSDEYTEFVRGQRDATLELLETVSYLWSGAERFALPGPEELEESYPG